MFCSAVITRAHFLEEYGRLRAVALTSDGYLSINTSNTDGRGAVHDWDDKIIRIDAAILE